MEWRRTHGLVFLTLSLGATSACEREFVPETVVDKLRILGVRAAPPDLAPGETAILSALVVDPSRAGERSTVLWLGCDPDPLGLGRSACSDVDQLQRTSDFAKSSDESASLPPGMRVIGLNQQAAFRSTPDLFRELSPEDSRRRTGTVAQVLMVAIPEEVPLTATREELEALFDRVQNHEIRSLLALTRIRVSEDPARNQNPVLGPLTVDGRPYPRGGALLLSPGTSVTVELDAPDESFETYEQPTPDGETHKEEKLIAAFYSTSGRFKEPRLALRSGTEERFEVPGEDQKNPLSADRRGTLWVVVRDTRGGQEWLEHPFFICEAARPEPHVARTTYSASADGGLLALEGKSLDEIVDVWVDESPAAGGGTSPGGESYQARLPWLAPGPHPVVVRTTACDEVDLPALAVP